MSDPVYREILANCCASIKTHCRIFHPDRFFRPFSPYHDQLFEVYDDTSIQKIVITAHRGFGKTSIFNFAIPSQSLLFKKTTFMSPISATSTGAVIQSENLKSAFTDQKFIAACSELYGLENGIKSDSFSRDMWESANGVFVLPRGRGQQVRGMSFGASGKRPGLIVVDDLEEAESVLSKEQRDKTKEWFFTDVCNSVDKPLKTWRIVVIGTILHEDCLLNALINDSSWTYLNFPLCDENFKSCWVNYMTDEDVLALKKEHEDQNILAAFYREFMNVCNPSEDAVFKPEYFRYYDEAEMSQKLNLEDNVIIVDPAKTAKMHSAKSAILGAAICRSNIYYRDLINERLRIDEIAPAAFDMADRLGAHTIAVEDAGLQDWIRHPFLNEMTARGRHYNIIWLSGKNGKEEIVSDDAHRAVSRSASSRGKTLRVAALAPYYRQGRIFHNKSCCGPLEAQLLSFPLSKYWDAMDTAAYTIQVMSIGDRYMEPDVPEDEDEDNLEAEYRRLALEDDPSFSEEELACYGS